MLDERIRLLAHECARQQPFPESDEIFLDRIANEATTSGWLINKGGYISKLYRNFSTQQLDELKGIYKIYEEKEKYDKISPFNSNSDRPPVIAPAAREMILTAPEVGPSSGTTAEVADAVDGFQVVLLIHGIRTQADWEPMVQSEIDVPGKIIVKAIKYGYFHAFQFWFPFWTRRWPVDWVQDEIRLALQKYGKSQPGAKLSIIAHSYGTYIVGEILKQDFTLRLHRLILCGSVLPQLFPWKQYLGRFDDDNVVNECGKSDIWPVLAQSASWGYGASGTHGFGTILVKNRFHKGGHGQYLEAAFVREFWVPFIRRGEYKRTAYETKMPPTPWWISVLGILPLKNLSQ